MSAALVVLYDGGCPMCRDTVRRLKAADWFNRLSFTDATDPLARASIAPQLTSAEALQQMYVRDSDELYGGYDAFVRIGRHVPLLWPLGLVGDVPILRFVGRRAYQAIAARRGRDRVCTDHVCAVPAGRSGKRWALIPVAVVAVMAVAVPASLREFYPFTTTPMFSDAPQAYSEFEVLSESEESLPLVDFQLQREYDGNPPGLGTGVRPPATLAQFGVALTDAQVIEHVKRQLGAHPEHRYVDVIHTVIGPVDRARVGVLRSQRLRVFR